jgi:MFS family permease
MDLGRLKPRRSLVGFAVAAAFLESAGFGLLSPLLPGLIGVGILRGNEPELLVAAYPLGMLLASVPAGILSARVGSRVVARVGLGLMAAAFAGFALATTGSVSITSRLLQGMGSGMAWVGAVGWLAESTPRSRRGATLAVVIAASFAGTLAGPLLGAIGAAAGKLVVFLPLAAIAIGLNGLAPATGGGGQAEQQLPAFVRAHRSAGVAGGHALVAVFGLVSGAAGIGVPLLLADHGAGPGLIAATFIIASIAQTLAARAIGRTGDRFGSLIPALVIAAVGAVALAAAAVSEQLPLTVMCLALGICAGLSLWTPGGLLLSLAYERTGVTQGLAVAAMNTTFGIGAAAGASVLPALAPDGSPASVVALAAAALAVTACGIGVALCAGARA